MFTLLAAGVVAASFASLDLVACAALPLTSVPAEEGARLVLEQLLPLPQSVHVVDVGRDGVLTQEVEKLG